MNLMCPARLVLLPAGSTADLPGERVAMVYVGPAAAESGESLADRFGARVSVVPEIQEAPAESAQDAVRRSNAALRGIADLHRGETVVVVTQGLSLGFGPGPGPVCLEHDGESWHVVPDPVVPAPAERRRSGS